MEHQQPKQRKEDQYNPGEQVIYREDNLILIAEVLENSCTEEQIKYRLRVAESLSPHFLIEHIRKGSEFTFIKNRNIGCVFGMGQIMEDTRRER